ncbi:hypothetical protein [Acinetobacter bereziniae]|uniref:hypothetical protein n=1 Tax=Acinetobacter bereziniae TaxID=106648 RepID=UPI000B03F36B|nr:hypothetical protein [Acinetobacter bereziniae]
MNNLSISSFNRPLIKSWFGFSVGAISVGISLIELFETFTLAKILSTLSFLCFWYPWSQMTHWNNSIKIKTFLISYQHPKKRPKADLEKSRLFYNQI